MTPKSFREHLNQTSTDFITEAPHMNYPTGVYVAVLPDEETNTSIKNFQNELKKDLLKDVEMNDEIHTTLIYSNKPLKEKIKHINNIHKASFDGYELFGEEQDVLVMKLKSESLHERNQELTNEYGFISDYDSYNPHITLSYGAKGVDLSKLPDYNGSMVLHKEYSEDLDEDWGE